MATPTPINIDSFLKADNYTFTNKDVKIENSDTQIEGERGQYIGSLKYKITYQN